MIAIGMKKVNPSVRAENGTALRDVLLVLRVMECLHLGDVLEQNHDANEGSHEKSGGGKFKARCTASTNPSERETLRQK